MRRIALLALCVGLAGCGFNAWDRPPYSAGPDPYRPGGDTSNMMRAEGETPSVSPLRAQPGNMWPGPIPAEPTLQTLEQEPMSLPGEPQPPPMPAPQGSSTPPGSNLPAVPTLPKVPPVPKVARPAVPAGKPAPSAPYQTRGGPGVPSGGTSAYQTITLPGGKTAIVVPNGNGTSTIIRSDGSVEIVPTPK